MQVGVQRIWWLWNRQDSLSRRKVGKALEVKLAAMGEMPRVEEQRQAQYQVTRSNSIGFLSSMIKDQLSVTLKNIQTNSQSNTLRTMNSSNLLVEVDICQEYI
jgi:hypothetical protein